jgi:hypothetical protein
MGPTPYNNMWRRHSVAVLALHVRRPSGTCVMRHFCLAAQVPIILFSLVAMCQRLPSIGSNYIRDGDRIKFSLLARATVVARRARPRWNAPRSALHVIDRQGGCGGRSRGQIGGRAQTAAPLIRWSPLKRPAPSMRLLNQTQAMSSRRTCAPKSGCISLEDCRGVPWTARTAARGL